MTALKAILVVLGSLLLSWFVVVRIVRKPRHTPAPAFIGRFLDGDVRRWFQPPNRVIKRSGIKEGMTIMELGCGGATFTTFAARTIGEQVKLYAVNIQPQILKQLERKLARPENQDIKNVELKQAEAYNLPFEKDPFNPVYLVTVLPEVPHWGRALREVKRVLKPGDLDFLSHSL